jgi:hypothetical protein
MVPQSLSRATLGAGRRFSPLTAARCLFWISTPLKDQPTQPSIKISIEA